MSAALELAPAGTPPTCESTLARGLWRDGAWHRRAVLAELDPHARSELLDRAADALPAERITALLAATVRSIGAIDAVDAETVRELSIGDRDRLVLALRVLSHGDHLECVFGCECGEELELGLDLQLILAAEGPAPPDLIAPGSDGAEVRIRAATGADHERAARRALTDPEAARRELVQGCLLPPSPAEYASLTTAEELLAKLDPGAEIVLEGDCPACARRVRATLDPIAHLWSELEQERRRLEDQVHVLALHYHWSEREIVALGPARRARYIGKLERDLGLS